MSEQDELSGLLKAVRRRLADEPDLWDSETRASARTLFATLSARLLHQMEVLEILADAVPCEHSHCRLKVTDVDGVAKHVDGNGKAHGTVMELPIPADDGTVSWITHEASPADRRRQSELLDIVANAVPCTHPNCEHEVTLTGGLAQHVDGNGKVLGRVMSVPIPAENDRHRWVPHEATPAAEAEEGQ